MLEQVKARNLRVGGLQQRFYGSGRFQRSCDIFKVLKIAACKVHVYMLECIKDEYTQGVLWFK